MGGKATTADTIFEGTRKPLSSGSGRFACVTGRQGASAMVLQRLPALPSFETAWSWLHHKLRRNSYRLIALFHQLIPKL
jgi:hypothetical protein